MAANGHCRICNIGIQSKSSQTFECQHTLCSDCATLSAQRSVCPTCSPVTSLNPTRESGMGIKPIFDRLYSENLELPQIKLTAAPKIIDLPPPMSPNPKTLQTFPTYSVPSSPAESSFFPNGSSRETSREPSPEKSLTLEENDFSTPPYESQYRRIIGQQGAKMEMEAEFFRRQLTDYVHSLDDHSTAFTEQLNSMTIEETVFLDRISTTEADVKKIAREKRCAIDRDEKRLLLKLKSRKEEHLRESEAARQDLTMSIGKLDNLSKTIQDVVANYSSRKLILGFDDIRRDVKRVLETRIGSVCFGGVSYLCSMEITSSSDKNLLGDVEFPPLKDKADDHSMFLTPVPLVASMDFGQAVIGLTVLDSRIYLIPKESYNIEVYDACSFSALTHLPLLHLFPQMLVPLLSDIASCPKSHTLYVVDDANASVYRLGVEGKLLTQWKLPNIQGLSVTLTGTVLIGSACKIYEYDPSGRIIKTVSRPGLARVTRKRGEVVPDTPKHFIKRESGELVVCDWKDRLSTHKVYELDDRGHSGNWHGGEPGSDENDLNEPCHLALAPFGHVIVADRGNNRVKLLDSNLRFVRNLISGSVTEPIRLFFEEASGRLYVGTMDGKLLVYRIMT